MTYSENLWLFATLLFGIIVVPGMDMLFVLANTLTGGLRSGFAATFGIMTGGAVHTLFGALGVGVILTLAPSLFNVMLAAGAAYMAWIGLTLLRSAITVDGVGRAKSRSLGMAFRQGAVTCLLNPKAYLFVFAVYPQFMKPQYGPVWTQALAMGLLTVLMQFGIYGGLALAAHRGSAFLVGNAGVTIWAGRAAGLLLIVVAGVTAWSGWVAGS
ncbi:LysE family translocator [Microvirga pudoricolor]|uniref:LysE family translocator n=1 Tax=Microvirga pudoricolor TaxID=2778729 RepID=UPI001951314A|nr:LysE family translocator [Microvirga pudoricolor]MBM6594814.1 LysE family translocator [Microvirga pudoricolor]